MNIAEAQGRLLNHLRLSGFEAMKEKWTWEHQGKPPMNLSYYSLPLYRTGARLLLYPEHSKSWSGIISFRVGSLGELAITGGRVERREKQHWRVPGFPGFKTRLDEIENRVQGWRVQSYPDLYPKALAALARKLHRASQGGRVDRALMMIERGDLSTATVAEAYSITYDRLIRSLPDRLYLGTVWLRIFR